MEATLVGPVPLEASPGWPVAIVWRLESVDEKGRRHPFGASGVFVQLESRSGGAPTVGFASGDDGLFEAVVNVPEGGIGGIAIGLGGTVSDASGTRADYVYFPIIDNPLPEVTNPAFPEAMPATAAPDEPVDTSGGGPEAWIVALALAVAATLAAAVELVRRRRLPAATR